MRLWTEDCAACSFMRESRACTSCTCIDFRRSVSRRNCSLRSSSSVPALRSSFFSLVHSSLRAATSSSRPADCPVTSSIFICIVCLKVVNSISAVYRFPRWNVSSSDTEKAGGEAKIEAQRNSGKHGVSNNKHTFACQLAGVHVFRCHASQLPLHGSNGHSGSGFVFELLCADGHCVNTEPFCCTGMWKVLQQQPHTHSGGPHRGTVHTQPHRRASPLSSTSMASWAL